MKWIVQAAPQDASTFNWDMVSAIGTSAAALIALGIWLHGKSEADKERAAEARLLASLLLPDLEELWVHLKVCEQAFWEHNSEGQRTQAILFTCATLAKNFALRKEMAAKELKGLNLLRFERLVESANTLERRESDILANCLRNTISLRYRATDLHDAPPEEDAYQPLQLYHQAIVETRDSAKAAVKAMMLAAGFNAEEVDTKIEELDSNPL